VSKNEAGSVVLGSESTEHFCIVEQDHCLLSGELHFDSGF